MDIIIQTYFQNILFYGPQKQVWSDIRVSKQRVLFKLKVKKNQ